MTKPIYTKSLGYLHRNQKTKERSPALTGAIKIQRNHFQTIAEQFRESGGLEVKANLAAWENHDSDGTPFLTVELQPSLTQGNSAKVQQQAPRKTLLDFMDEDE